MKIIKTKSFELAINVRGDQQSERFMLCLPGRLDTKDYAHLESHLDYFAERGYFVVSFDPPGTWESPGETSLYTTENYLKAIDELIAYFGDKPTVTLGHSRGGTMSMVAGVKNQHITHFIAVMSHWGPSGTPGTDEETYVSYRDLPPGTERTKEQERIEMPMTYFDDQTEYVGLDTCDKPKLFFAGLQDTIVSPEGVRETFDMAAEPKQLCELNAEHDYRLDPDAIAEVNRAVKEFLLKNKK